MRSILKKGLIYVWILSILINACPVIVFASFFQKEEMISNLEEISLEEEKQKEIINLCFDLFNGESKSEVKKHNKSALKLLDIFNEVKENEEYAESLYSSLLKHESDKVKFEAACCCLKLKIKRHKTRSTLKKIKRHYPKTFIGVSAALVLEYEKWHT